jgi:hypothetical protein
VRSLCSKPLAIEKSALPEWQAAITTPPEFRSFRPGARETGIDSL